MANTIKDRRGDPTHPVVRVDVESHTWISGETAAVDKTVDLNAIWRSAVVEVSNPTNVITVTLALLDQDGCSRSSTAAIARNASTLVSLTGLWIDEAMTVRVTPSGDPGASGLTVTVHLYGE